MANDVLVAIGEALIDFIPNKKACKFSDVTGFYPALGGAPANVCVAFSKLGGKSRILTQLGDDPFGYKIIEELTGFGVDTSFIKITDKANTALAFVSLDPDGNRTFSFYRNPSADMLYSLDNTSENSLKDVFCLHFCSVSLGDFPMKNAHKKAIDIARKNGGIISFDLNLRFQLWKSKDELYKTVNEFIPFADIIKISNEELEFTTKESDPDKGIKKLLKGNVKLVVYTCGKHGAYGYTDNYKIFSPSCEATAVDTTGAGDGFISSFLWKFRQLDMSLNELNESESQIKKCLDFANKFCAKSIQRKGAIPSYPTQNEF